MDKIGSILKALLNKHQINETQLARETGIGQPVIHRMASGETDNPKVASLSPIARFFNLSISQLIGDEPLPDYIRNDSFIPKQLMWTRLPILSWEQTTTWPTQFDAANHDDFVSTEVNVTDNAFAVRMQNSTMEPLFPENTLLVIEPTITIKDRDFGLAYIEGHRQATFKQLLIDGETTYLKPLNKDYQTQMINKPHKILGVLVEARVQYPHITERMVDME